MGYGAILLGHNRHEISQAIVEVLEKGFVAEFDTPLTIELAKRITEIIPCAESEFEKIYASAENYKCSPVKMKYSDFYDHAVVVAQFQNGKLGILDIGCPVDYGYDARMKVLGTKGVMFVGGINDNQVMVCTKGSGAVSLPLSA